MPYDFDDDNPGCGGGIVLLIIAIGLFLMITYSPKTEYVVDTETPYVEVYIADADGDYCCSDTGDSVRQYDDHFVIYGSKRERNSDSLEIYRQIIQVKHGKYIKYKKVENK